jgi:hypothetical protein
MNEAQKGHPPLERLAAFDQGQLRPDEWTEIERHVSRCDLCCRKLEELPEDGMTRLLRSSAGKTLPGHTPRPDTQVQPPEAGGSLSPDNMVPPELANHPRYRILELLGAGGMGVVFKAEHRLMERVVALKVINRKLIDHSAGVERFRLEAKAAARLAHPNIVTAHDADQAGDVHFLVMEFVDGAGVDRLIEKRGPLPVGHACYLAQQAALGLQHAFERGMVHRDIKPANLLLTTQGQVKILDFGLARFASETSVSEGLTPAGTVVGTPDYMAPEQARNPRRADIRADIYSLGCTLYHLLAGQVPFPGTTFMEKLFAHQEQVPAPLSTRRRDLPPGLEPVLGRMLARDPAQRYATPAEVALALAPYVKRPGENAPAPPAIRPCAALAPTGLMPVSLSRRRRRRRAVAAGLLLLAAVASLASLALWPRSQRQDGQAGATRPPSAAGGTRFEPPAEDDPASMPVTPSDLKIGLSPDEARALSIAWIKPNCAPIARRDELVAKASGYVDTAREKDEEVVLHFGPALTASKKATILGSRGGTWCVFELSPAQARHWPYRAGLLHHLAGVKNGPTPQPARVELSAPRIDHALEVDASRDLTGSIRYRRRQLVDGTVALRVAFYRGDMRITRFHRRDALPADEGVLRFKFDGLNSAQTKLAGPLVLTLELCTLKDPAKPSSAVVVSNPVVVAVNVAPAPEPRSLMVGLTPKEARQRTVQWIKDQSRSGPDSDLVSDMSRKIEQALDQNKEFLFEIGSGLLASGKPTLLGCRGGTFYVFPLTPEQARHWRIAERSFYFQSVADKGRRQGAPSVDLSMVKIDQAMNLDGRHHVTGTVRFERKQPTAGTLGIRLSYYHHAQRPMSCQYLKDGLSADQGSLSFKCSPIKDAVGPVVVFLELCAFTGPGPIKLADGVVVSNTVISLVNVAPIAKE